MKIVLDPDVMKLAEFAQQNILASRLVSVAIGLSKIAPLIWGHNQGEDVETLRLVSDPILADGLHTQSSANE